MPREKELILTIAREGLPVTLEKDELELFLPHRRNALKIDRVVFNPMYQNRISGFKRVLENDPDLDGHFDGRLVYPGHAIVECANLTAAMLILLTEENLVGYATSADFSCECRRPVFPGDDIEIMITFINKERRRGHDFYCFNYIVQKTCNNFSKIAALGTITGTAI